MSETRTYRGTITQRDHGEAFDILFLSDDGDDPLARRIEDDMDELGRYLSVRYFIADAERSLAELEDSLIRQLVGDAEVEYHSHYSEVTGYLWTDENIVVGGHDLLSELDSSLGKFAHLEINFAKEPPS